MSTETVNNQKKLLWQPSKEKIAQTNMNKYKNFLSRRYNLNFHNYNEMYEWSVKHVDKFWETIWIYGEIYSSKKYTTIMDTNFGKFIKIPRPKWFVGAELNFAENLLKYRDENNALISWSENKEPVYITYKELYDLVAKCAAGLIALGVEKGDRVAAFITNIPEAVIGMLATSSIGAIWTSCSPDFGFQGVLDRFGQIKPKVLFAINGYTYNGKDFPTGDKIKHITQDLEGLVKTIIINRIDSASPTGEKFMTWEDLMNNEANEVEFEQLPFDHPLYIMYSSGTTGVPKCIVHGQGGTLLQHYKELALHTNLTREDTISYFTTCGWMMWNWLVSSLNIGAAIFLYDGSPSFPNLNILWEAVEKEKITVFGTSPKFLSSCQKAGMIPKSNNSLFSLKVVLSTGSPLSKDNFEWVYQYVNSNVQLSSISGGTDIISCFMLGNPILPVYIEEIQCRGLGMKIEAFGPEGQILTHEKGELVCMAPFPSMPIYFWDDEKDDKYHNAYFNKFKGFWYHGDFIVITRQDGVIVHGRSDSTLNPGGVRIGTAEIYRLVEGMDEIKDSIVVGQNWQGDVRVVLFVVLQDGVEFNSELVKKIKEVIQKGATFRHVPNFIKQITEVPVTISGKKVEIAVSNLLNNEPVNNESALANPQSLDQFRDIKFEEEKKVEKEVKIESDKEIKI
jgi:acetoacetyl-CoA synthetase